jgi:predicted membrane-bound spermidine synthase
VVGIEVYAITTGIRAFFAGLALGGLLLGRWADRLQQPVLLYAGLEVLVAVLGVGATFAMSLAASPFAWLEQHVGLLAWVLPFALVGIPTLLMGGTLPVLVRSLASDPQQLGKAGGHLYADNTAGAIAGTLLAAFLLIATLGVRGIALAAAMLDLLAAAGPCGSSAIVRSRLKPRPNTTQTKQLIASRYGCIRLPAAWPSATKWCGRSRSCNSLARALMPSPWCWRRTSPGCFSAAP